MKGRANSPRVTTKMHIFFYTVIPVKITLLSSRNFCTTVQSGYALSSTIIPPGTGRSRSNSYGMRYR
jgi:hypothetical protein